MAKIGVRAVTSKDCTARRLSFASHGPGCSAVLEVMPKLMSVSLSAFFSQLSGCCTRTQTFYLLLPGEVQQFMHLDVLDVQKSTMSWSQRFARLQRCQADKVMEQNWCWVCTHKRQSVNSHCCPCDHSRAIVNRVLNHPHKIVHRSLGQIAWAQFGRRTKWSDT